MKIKMILTALVAALCITAAGQGTSGEKTTVNVILGKEKAVVDAMIYGQMLEDCNDSVIYGGLIRGDGSEHPKVHDLLQPLNIPVMRWPAGTYIHEYHWENGIGPRNKRPVVDMMCWGGQDPNTFGTDEFLQWCERMGIKPYLNFNMSNSQKFAGSLGEALNWIEYVNGPVTTAYGMKRAQNGHPRPYNVEFWCIGNENYGSYGVHTGETATVYSNRLHRWAKAIKGLYPTLKLLGIGHTYNWNDTVMAQNGKLVDYLTLHYYMTAAIKNNKLENPRYELFAPAKVEENLKASIEGLNKMNKTIGRENTPVKFSIDEWNNRHSVFNGVRYNFTRKDARRQFDVATVAGMLNVFIRQSPAVGMANYIFPVNGHGLIKTAGDNDAYKSALYYVFELYRQYMVGNRVDMEISGSKVDVPMKALRVEGDMNEDVEKKTKNLTVIDGAAVAPNDSTLNVGLVNRSTSIPQTVILNLPKEYKVDCVWKIESDNINEANTTDNRNAIAAKKERTHDKNGVMEIEIKPAGVVLVNCRKN